MVNTSGRIDTPEDYTIRTWLNAEADFLTGGGELTNVPVPEPHPNELATRQAAIDGLYPSVTDEDGNTVDPLDVVGARHVGGTVNPTPSD